MATLILDTHVLHWLTAEPSRLSSNAATAIDDANELGVADITWFEMAWLARRGRISFNGPADAWLRGLAQNVRTFAVTPAIASTAASLPETFPRDPVDRLIYATAIETNSMLVTKDGPLRQHPHPTPITIW